MKKQELINHIMNRIVDSLQYDPVLQKFTVHSDNVVLSFEKTDVKTLVSNWGIHDNIDDIPLSD
jgi:hypothetical protein